MPRLAVPAADSAFQRCRFCCTWKVLESFSSAQRLQREPVCRACAGFALAPAPQRAPELRSVPVEHRYALVLAFCGDYEGLPQFNEDILRTIISFLVVRLAPFLADRGDSYRCTACQRDFRTLEQVLQHAETSQRHVPLGTDASKGGRRGRR